MPVAKTAKLFKNGRSQAVRLPKEYRFKGSEVMIRQEGSRVILEPLNRKWSNEFVQALLGPEKSSFPDREQPSRFERRKKL